MSRSLVPRTVRLSASLSLALSCCPAPGQIQPKTVAVREASIRSEAHPLPLSAESRTALVMFLAAGGNNDNLDDGQATTIVYPDAEQRWGPLLDRLARPENVDLDDMTNGTYSKWFTGEPVRQVIDATDARPNLACPPFAFGQDRFQWVFKCGQAGKLGNVIVQQAVAERAEAP